MDKNDNLTFSISQVAEMLGVVPGTIRNWEKSGLIAAKRSDSNYRVFTVDDIAKLRKIREYSIDKHMGAHAIKVLMGTAGESGSELEESVHQSREKHYSKKLLSEKWREIRKMQGYTLEEVSREVGISVAHLSKLENGGNVSLQLMRDLSFLHAHDVIHRDIAPDNVKVLEDGTLTLIDFGLARPYMMDAQVTINLKPGFAPCEQYSSHGQGAYTDVYALAATMYYCFTGSVIPDAYERKVKDTIIAPRSLCPKLTARQERALLRALAVDYRQRIQNMQEFEKAYSSDVPVADPPPVGDPPAESGSRLKESLRVLREQPLLPAAAGLLFLIAAALQIAL